MPETISVEQALELVLGFVKPLPTERVALLDALGRVLAEDATSDIDVAPFDNSAMDGFAVRAADLAGAAESSPVELDVVAHIAAGDYWEGEVGPGQAARIMTGSPVPAGADSIVMVERTHPVTGDGGIGSRVALRTRAQARRAHPPPWRGGARWRRGRLGGRRARTGRHRPARVDRPRHRRRSTAARAWACSRPAANSSRSPRSPAPARSATPTATRSPRRCIAAGGVPVRYGIVPDDMDATRAAFELAARRVRLHPHERGRLGGRLRLRQAGARGARATDLLQGEDASRAIRRRSAPSRACRSSACRATRRAPTSGSRSSCGLRCGSCRGSRRSHGLSRWHASRTM